jgi:multisubunit Na+/H+ antiporter MnhG subunit
MLYNRLPIVIGLFAAITIISTTTIFFRLIGMDRGEAFYVACLTFAVIVHFVSRRLLRQAEKE